MRKIGRNLLYALFFFFVVSLAHAQNEVPIHPVDGEYITDWLLLGPFFPGDLEKDLLVDAGGESNIEPNEGDTVLTPQGDTLTWKRYHANGSHIALFQAIGDHEHAAAYAFCTLRSEAEEKVKFLLGSDDGASVWINGERVHHNTEDRWLAFDEDMFEADLESGPNRCLVKVSQSTYDWGFAIRAFPHHQPVFVTPTFFLSPDFVKNMSWLPNNLWKYHPGDDTEWAELDFDDSSWEVVNPELRPNELPESGWHEIGWFRFQVVVDPSLINKPLGLSVWQAGAIQLYLDGSLIYTFGEQSDDWTGVPKVLTLEGRNKHVIAVRYSNTSLENFHKEGLNSGFSLQLGKLNQMTEETAGREKTFLGFQMFLTALSLAIGLLHLILFAFLPDLRRNLFFALFLFSYAATIYFDYQILLSTDIGQRLWSFRMHCAVLPLWVLFQLRFVYSLFYRNLPKQFWAIFLSVICLGGMAVYKPYQYFELFQIVHVLINIEIIRIIIIAFMKKKEGHGS